MGYQTDYKLHTCPEISQEKYIELLKKVSDYDWWEDNCGVLEMSAKWYDHEAHMREVSSIVKDILFILEGDGEESGDTWKKYYKNGLQAECRQISVFEEFKEENLK